MPDLTPIRVRGKRKGLAAEKWNYGRQRKVRKTESVNLAKEDSGDGPSSLSEALLPTKKKRSQRRVQLSRLEELPTEVIQYIFELSENLDLPSASPRLVAPLQNAHLHDQLTARILEHVSGQQTMFAFTSAVAPRCVCKAADLAAATRLMNSRFFTHSFLKKWLRKEFDRRDMQRVYDSLGYRDIEPEKQLDRTWWDLRPSLDLLPPKKLLFAPFTDDKLRMLELVTSHIPPRTAAGHYPVLNELASGGLREAVAERSTRALDAFWHLGVKPDMGLLRQAIIEEDCDRGVVYSITAYTYHFCPWADIEWLDPELWSWVAKTESLGDPRGGWLKEILRFCAKTKALSASDTTEETRLFRRYLKEQPDEPFDVESFGKKCRARDLAARDAMGADPYDTE